MTSTQTDTAERLCACGCGQPAPPKRAYLNGHRKRAEARNPAATPLPTAAELEQEDGEDIGPILPDGQPPEEEGEGVPRETPEPADDGPPAHADRSWKRRPGGRGKTRKTRLTAAVRQDVDAKFGLMCEIPGRLWAARDPVCGGAFVDNLPQIRGAAVELICQSPDLVEWFTGSGGQFMLWFNLAAACWPVATIVLAHHVFHTLEQPQQRQQDLSAYAA